MTKHSIITNLFVGQSGDFIVQTKMISSKIEFKRPCSLIYLMQNIREEMQPAISWEMNFDLKEAFIRGSN